MQTTYISSAIAFRSKSSVCYSSNDYYLNNRANRTSSCTCCAFPFNGVPVNPSFFYGLRQSTLIHWPASRRLILGGGDRFFRVPTSDFDRKCYADCHTVKESCQCCCTRSCSGTDLGRVCYGKSYPVKESCDCSSISRRRGKARRFKCVVWEEDSESCDSGIDGTMEAVLGLLAEEDSQNCVGVRGKNSSRLVAGRVQAEGRGISDYRKRESDCFKKNSKGTFQYVTKSREEEGRSSGRREGSLRGEKREIRKDGSSCSSYYSTLSSNEIDDSDVDVQVDQGKFSGESLNRHNKLLRIGKEDVSVKNVIKQSIRKEEGAAGYREASMQGNAASTSMVVGSDRQSVYEREKNLRDVSIRRGESRIESIKNHLNVTGIHKISDETTSVSQNRFRGRVDSSISSTYSNNEAREQQIQQDESRKQSLRQTGMSRILDTDSDIEWVSSSHTQFKGREESLAASVDSPEGEREIHNQIARSIGQNESRRKPQQFSRMLESHETDSRNTSNSQRQFESALKDREESSMSSHFKAEEQSSQTDQQVVWETKSTKESQDLSSISVINDNNKTIVSDSQSYSERRMKHREETSALIVSQLSNNHEGDVRTSNSERFCESTLKNKEESSTSLSSFHQAEDQNQTAQNVVRKTKSTNSSQGLINISATSVRDSHKLYERRMSLQEENSASHLDFVQEASKGKTSQASEDAIKQLGSKKISERLTEISSFRESSANVASSSQPLNSAKRESGQQMDEKKENERNSVSMVTPPPAQILHGISLETAHYQEPSSGNAAGDVYSERPGSRSRTSYTQVAAPSSPNEINSGTRVNHSHENQSETIFDEDALGSANRLEESSVRFVRQFVENLSHEVSTSELPEEKKSYQRTSINKDAEYTQQSSNQSVLEDVHSQVHDSGRSSSRSAPKGPADEMWDVAGPSAEVPARTEAPGEVTPTTENAIAKSGRSLWTIIGDIVRLRWGARSETHVSISKSGGKSSSNESVSSEAWFSSHEADEKDDENVKKGRRIIPKVRGSSEQSSVLKAGTQSLEGSLEGMSSNSRIFQNEADVFSSLGTVEGSSASTGASSKEESINLKLDERSEHGPPSTTTITPSSLWPSKPLTRSPAVKGDISESSSAVKGEISDSSKPVASRRDFVQMEQRNLMRSPAVKGAIPGSSKVVASQSDVQLEQLGGDNPTRGSETEAKDGELKRRKLHRNKQVEKETFEDWEEAYRIENEQRKIDEMFMREALLEAKKAADTWEVPVGAVLVQHGKIVARGCNLVEDLRDSTAHAEMICIREASNILRTWRLSETTLYVTLEPCAMCAGAILQARIDTVVWGAPNKLLGADGSWVRLFPGEGEVGGSSNLPSQPSGPVHPFHPKITIRRGILATECGDVMQQFFQLRRKNKKSDSPPTSSLSVSAHPSKFFSKMHDIFSIMFCL